MKLNACLRFKLFVLLSSQKSELALKEVAMSRKHKMTVAEAAAIGSSADARRIYWRRVRWLQRVLPSILSIKTENIEVLNTPGPLVLFPIHQSLWDPPLLALLSPRMLRAAFKREGFDWAPGWFAHGGAFGVKRGDRREAQETSQVMSELLKQEECLLVFPQGTREPGGVVQQINYGVFSLLEENVSVVCIGISYNWRRRRIGVSCSELIDRAHFGKERNQRKYTLIEHLNAQKERAKQLLT